MSDQSLNASEQQLDDLILKPIGHFVSEQTEPYQAARQPDKLGAQGHIQLAAKQQFEQALQDLEGCSHIWIIFGFHKNSHWKPLVQTPRSQKKIGVFATRSPYRPNPIGMSLVRLISVDGLNVFVDSSDILNGSPVYDIKPYHPEADLALNAQISWLENETGPKYKISFSPLAEEQLDWLQQQSNQGTESEKKSVFEIKNFISRQLEYDPLNKKKKRITSQLGYWTLAYRTWRIDYSVNETNIAVLAICSGYTAEELADLNTDTYQDKKLHQKFFKEFN